MCGVIDKLLPVAGAVVGGVFGGPWGAAAGSALGGSVGNYFQTHNIGSSLEAGAIAGGTTYLGGEMGMGAGGGGAGGTGTGGTGSDFGNMFTTGSAGSGLGAADSGAPELAGLGSSSANGLEGLGNSASSLGSLESGLGGASLLGSDAGTGTVGGLSNSLSGGLGATDPGSLSSGITGGSYTSGLGGGTGPLGQSGVVGSSGLGGGPTSGSSNPTQPTDMTGAVSSNPTNMGGGSLSSEGAQTNAMASNPSLMAQTGVDPAANQDLSSLYGPNSTAAGSPTGTGIAGSAPQGSVTASPSTLGQSMGNDDFSWSSPATLGTLMKLGNTGLGMYQQYAQQQAQNNYANSIQQMFSPNSAYAQQMQQTLARQDAAAGRNSQGGTRAVQLAAALTQAQAQAMGGNNYAKAATATPGASALNNVFAQFGNPQGIQQLSQFGSGAFNSLQGLFS